jgi:hypothetical protein
VKKRKRSVWIHVGAGNTVAGSCNLRVFLSAITAIVPGEHTSPFLRNFQLLISTHDPPCWSSVGTERSVASSETKMHLFANRLVACPGHCAGLLLQLEDDPFSNQYCFPDSHFM